MDLKKRNRREFLKEMSLYAGSTAFLASIPWLNVFSGENGKNNAASDRVRLGVIGVGSRGHTLLLNLLEIENVEIAAVCDNYQPNFERAIETTGGKARAFNDYRQMLDKVNDLDAVVIATPLHEHAHITFDFLNAGIHVFCEKSMARTLEDTKQMADTAKTSGKILQIGQQRLFNPVYLDALERVRTGEIGQITQVRAYWHRNNDWRRPVPTPELERKINWRLYSEYSAGLMTELATHQIQVANWFIDQVPAQVVGTGSICFWKDGREVYDHVALVYDYPGGAKCIYDSMIANKHYGLEEQIMGNLGTIEPEVNRIYSENPAPAPGIVQLIQNLKSGISDVIPIGGATWLAETKSYNTGKPLAAYDNNDTFLQLVAFVKAVKAGKPYANLLREAYHATVASLLGLQAMDTNAVVQWPEEYTMEKET
jgi:predicted dehydrogenase